MLEMTRFEVETTRLQGGEEGFNLPPLGVQGQSMVGFGVGSDNQILAIKFDTDEREPVVVDPAALGEEFCLTDTQGFKQHPGVTGSAFGANQSIVLDADVKGQAGSFEVFKPALTDKLPVGNHSSNLLGLDQLEEAFQKRASLGAVRVTRFAQEAPHDREGNPSVGDREHQDVDVEATQLPVTTVNRDDQVLLLGQECQHQPPEVFGVETEVGKEALDTAVVGIGCGVGVQYQGKLAEGHGADPNERKRKGSSELEPGPWQSQGCQGRWACRMSNSPLVSGIRLAPYLFLVSLTH